MGCAFLCLVGTAAPIWLAMGWEPAPTMEAGEPALGVCCEPAIQHTRSPSGVPPSYLLAAERLLLGAVTQAL